MGWEVQPGMSFNPFSYTETAFAIYALYYYIYLYFSVTGINFDLRQQALQIDPPYINRVSRYRQDHLEAAEVLLLDRGCQFH